MRTVNNRRLLVVASHPRGERLGFESVDFGVLTLEEEEEEEALDG